MTNCVALRSDDWGEVPESEGKGVELELDGKGVDPKLVRR